MPFRVDLGSLLFAVIVYRRCWRRPIALVLAGWLGAASGGAWAQTDSPPPVDFPQAATRAVLGIIGYTTWPSPPVRVRVCVAGDPAWLQPLIDAPATVGGRPVIATASPDTGEAWVDACEVLYLGAMADARRRALLSAAAEKPMITVEAGPHPCAGTAMFCLSPRDHRLAAQTNLDAVARSGVRIHSNVLQLLRKRPGTP